MGSPVTKEEEERPLLPKSQEVVMKGVSEAVEPVKASAKPAPPSSLPPQVPVPEKLKPAQQGWTAAGLPLGHCSVVGQPVVRTQWDSGLFSCFGRSDEFCSSDLEVCLLGSLFPCFLYASNAERLRSDPRSFSNHCMAYTGLYFLGQSLLGCSLAPCLSFHNRTALRRQYNLEGTCEAFSRECGCCGSMVEDSEELERCEAVCDFTTHFLCHTCALCQEGRELRRRLPHPGFNGRPVMAMIPPTEQTMARGA